MQSMSNHWLYSSYHALTKPGETLLHRVDVMEWFGGTGELEEAHVLIFMKALLVSLHQMMIETIFENDTLPTFHGNLAKARWGSGL